MIRRTTLVALLLAASACGGGSDSDEKPADAGKDASSSEDATTGSASDSGSSADAAPAAKPDQVTNTGDKCTTANSCQGDAPSCVTQLNLAGQNVPFPSGYCSATCKANIECGSSGECPVGESLKGLTVPLIPPELLASFVPSNCYKRCNSDSDCRVDDKYRCATILSALSQGAGMGLNFGGFDVSTLLTGPIKDNKYCLPPAPPAPDGGAASDGGQDAGVATDAGKSDAAQSDASQSDAG